MAGEQRDVDGYEGRIGRYGASLAAALMRVAGVSRGQRALDVGAGSGALTAPLAAVLGPDRVGAIDPDAEALAILRERVPGWQPLAVPDGAPGVFLATLDDERRDRVKETLHARLGRPSAAFTLEARAWYARGTA